jgi:tetratricopeptide (TPR) repeat protein
MLASLEIFEEGDVHRAKADLLSTLGEIAYAETDYHRSQKYHRQALQIGRALNNRRILGWSSLGLAPVAREKEEFEKARELYEKSYEYHADIGYKIPSAASLMHLGDTLILLGDHAEAEVCYQKALAINQDIAFQAGIGYSIYGFGDIAFAMGQYERAYQHYEEALNLFRIIGDRYGVIARLLSDLGKVAVAMDDPDDAKKRFREAFHIEQHDQYARTCLAIVEGYSAFLAKSGELARAVELCSLVVYRPESNIFIRRGASKRLDECMDLLSPSEFIKAKERGKDLNLRITAEQLLAALGD